MNKLRTKILSRLILWALHILYRHEPKDTIFLNGTGKHYQVGLLYTEESFIRWHMSKYFKEML